MKAKIKGEWFQSFKTFKPFKTLGEEDSELEDWPQNT